MKYWLIVILSAVSAAPCCGQPSITGKDIIKDISYLASDRLEGRFPGSKGNELAAKYIERAFKKARVEPLFHNYEQPFSVVVKLNTSSAGNFIKTADTDDFLMNKDYSIFPFPGPQPHQDIFFIHRIGAYQYYSRGTELKCFFGNGIVGEAVCSRRMYFVAPQYYPIGF